METAYSIGLFVSIIGVFLALGSIAFRVIYARKIVQPREYLLCVAVACMAWHLFVFVLIQTKLILDFPNFYNKGIPLYYLIAPCMYLYVRHTIHPNTSWRYSWLHSLPFWFGLLDVLPYAFAPAAEKQALLQLVVEDVPLGLSHGYGFLDQNWHFVIRFVLAFAYMLAQWKLLFAVEMEHSRQRQGRIRTLNTLTIFYSIHFVLQSSIVLNYLSSKLQGGYILGDATRLVWVGLIFVIFALWLFVNSALLCWRSVARNRSMTTDH